MEIIAEIGQNHNGDMDLARDLIYAAKENGADVAKFQLFSAIDTFPPKESNPWFDYNCKTELTKDNLFYLKDVCENAGIEFMSSAFDVERIAWLEEVNVARHKVASRSLSDNNLLSELAKIDKVTLISLGMWGDGFPETSIEQVQFLYCISKYPTPLEEINMATVDFASYFGFSDHSIGITAALAAFSRGANIVEKHFTLDKKMHGPDHEGSMSPDELLMLHKYRLELEKVL